MQLHPVGEPKLLAFCHASEIQVPDVKVPLLQATETTNGYLPLFVCRIDM